MARYTFRFALHTVVAAFVATTWLGCAAERAPTGGPVDKTPPELAFTAPPNEVRNYTGERYLFYFNEFLSPGAANGSVFISPVLAPSAFTTQVTNHRLDVFFHEPLDSNTTYVLTLNQNVADFNGTNALAEPIQVAFSTGPTLDSGAVFGRMQDAYTQEAIEEMIVLLYHPDSIQDNEFTNITPSYAALATADGQFKLRYIKPGRYRILGLKDANANYRYDLPSETVATPASDSVLVVRDTGDVQTLDLRAFTPDSTPPRLVRAVFTTDHAVAFTFTEPVQRFRLRGPVPSPNGTVGNSPPIDLVVSAPDAPQKELRAWLPERLRDSTRFELVQVADSLGNAADTLVILPSPPALFRDTVLKPRFSPGRRHPLTYSFTSTSPFDTAQTFDSLITLVDTAGVPVPLQFACSGFELSFTLPENIAPDIGYTLTIDTLLSTLDGDRPDSLAVTPLRLGHLSTYASFTGTLVVPDSLNTPPEQLILLLENTDEKLLIRHTGAQLNYPFLPAGTYRLSVIEDLNNDGRWTPGSLRPWRQPEPITPLPEALSIREGWSYEDVQLYYPPGSAPPTDDTP